MATSTPIPYFRFTDLVEASNRLGPDAGIEPSVLRRIDPDYKHPVTFHFVHERAGQTTVRCTIELFDTPGSPELSRSYQVTVPIGLFNGLHKYDPQTGADVEETSTS